MHKKNKPTAQRIREARLAAGLTQLVLAIKSGIDQSDISKYEREVYHPTIPNLKRLGKALRTKWKDLAED